MRIALAIAAVVAVPSATPPNVARLILQPPQVGKGYVMLLGPDGRGVTAQRTMNLCGTDYASERLRTARIQVNYLKRNAKIGISNEVVTYRTGGAAQAMREAFAHAANCPNKPIDPGVTGLPKLAFHLTRVTDPRLLNGSLAVRIDATGIVKGKRLKQTSYAVYQRRGNVLSGVYSFGTGTAAQLRLCLHAAEQSAKNLRRGASVGPSPPTA